MSRIPPTKPSDLTPEQKEAHDYMSEVAEKTFGYAFEYKNQEGAFIGPFAPLLQTPALCKPFFELTTALGQIKELPPAARETVILTVGSHFKAPYETYAHVRVAARQTDLSQEQIDLIKDGGKPKDLSEADGLAFDAAKALCEKPGPLEKGIYDGLVKHFGKKGALAVVHYVALYAYTCVLLNGCDVSVPE